MSILSGMYAYARFGSMPSLLGAFGVGGLLGMSSMRMRDNMDYGLVGAAGMSIWHTRRRVSWCIAADILL